MMRCKQTGETEYDLTKTKKLLLVVALKKKLKTFNHFSRLYLHFLGYFQVWKIAGQISRLFQEFKTLHEPYLRHASYNLPQKMYDVTKGKQILKGYSWYLEALFTSITLVLIP